MKQKLFIKDTDLGKVLEALAEETLKQSDKVSTHVTIAYDQYDGYYIRVDVREAKKWESLVCKTYSIVTELDKVDDVVDDTITLALGKLKLNNERTTQKNDL